LRRTIIKAGRGIDTEDKMTREEIMDRFRQENPEISTNVITDAVLRSWCITGDKDVCARARLIGADDTFDVIEDEDSYDLTVHLSKFFDIDELPGGGIAYIDTSSKEKRITKKSIAGLDDMSSSWRTASSGTPKHYYRRNQFLHLYPAPDDTISSIHAYYIAIPEDFDDDNKTPYNQLLHLEPFHPAIIFYLTWRAKAKVGKPQDADTELNQYEDYIKFIKREIGGGKHGPVYFRPIK
jgi:hypothetical protein